MATIGNKGWIALDIDGTITLDKYSVPERVTSYLRQKHLDGWKIVMATGRSFRFAAMALSKFDFPYILMPQNGTAAIEMPGKRNLFTRYLPYDAIVAIEEAFEGIDSDFIIYTGFERDDLCFFRPGRFPADEWPAVEAWQERQKEKWEAVEKFTRESIPSFPLAKCFGSLGRMEKIATRLKATKRFEVALMRNPFDPQDAIVLITRHDASKGLALDEILNKFGRGSLVIAAGDDENDVSLLRAADVKIAMSHAPDLLQEIADFIASPTEKMGIIYALEQACNYKGHNGKRV